MTDRPESETPITDSAWDIAQALTLRQRAEHMRDCARKLESALTARERDALDARRYRWLRSQLVPFLDWKVSTVIRAEGQRPERIWLTEGDLDAAIDAERKEDSHAR